MDYITIHTKLEEIQTALRISILQNAREVEFIADEALHEFSDLCQEVLRLRRIVRSQSQNSWSKNTRELAIHSATQAQL